MEQREESSNHGDVSTLVENRHVGEKQHEHQQHTWSSLLVVSAFVITIGSSIPCGYNLAIIGIQQNVIESWVRETVASTDTWSFLNEQQLEVFVRIIVLYSFYIGGIIGSLVAVWLPDKGGRKKALLLGNMFGVGAGCVNFILAQWISSLGMFFMGRVHVGMAAGLATSVIPMYLVELAPVKLKTSMAMLFPLGVSIGIILAHSPIHFLLGNYELWPFLLSFFALCTVVSWIWIRLLPESPHYLYTVKGEKDRAVEELTKLRNTTSDIAECELKCNTKHEGCTENRLFSKGLATSCVFQLAKQCSGVNIFLIYGMSMFITTGALSPSMSQCTWSALSILHFFMLFIMYFGIGVLSRRSFVLLSGLLTSFVMLLSVLAAMHQDGDSYMAKIFIACMIIYIIVMDMGLEPFPYFIASELFELQLRSKAMSISSVISWQASLVIVILYSSASVSLQHVMFCVLPALTLLFTLYVHVTYPREIQKKTVE